jgi:hypothetical protein
VLLWTASAAAQTRLIDVETSMVTVHLSPSSPGAAEHIVQAPIAEGSVDDTDAPHFALVIDVAALRVVDSARSAAERDRIRERFIGPEGLDLSRFSRITYHSLAIDTSQPGVWAIRGELELHGRFLPLDARAVRQEDRFTGSTSLWLTDYGIPPASAPGTAPPAANQVRVDFDIVLAAP